ncbi:transmembrane emp24 domain-containing protein p24delta9-like [Salvia splendens]|uniref:transmembrane emp24 domain-containing protein p24delta9-like n=1 Tax=Salvia splendens TaxID=180675 RepID=UPI001C25E3B2|nr:transmembrane emp24 domain-containing protein p24delta9-like [Salvia splendens]
MNFPIQRKGFLLLLISVLWLRADSIRFDLESGRTKCISEDIKTNSMTVGKYHIVNPNEGHPLPDSHKVTVRVTSAYGNSHHYSDQVTEGHFAFQAVEEGDYMACFFAADHKPSTAITVDFDWKSGVAAKDWTSVVRKGSVELMETELKKMLDTVQTIHDEMYYLREREEEMQLLNKATNNKMFWFSFLSILVCLSVTGIQLWHLKSFFEKKKLI